MGVPVVDQELPRCKVCYNDMLPQFADFNVCAACYFAAQRAQANRPRYTQPSYTSPLNRLDREIDGRTVRD